MKTVSTLQELIDVVENISRYNGNGFENHFEAVKKAEEYFLSVTNDMEDPQQYYNGFGLEYGKVFTDKIKTEKYFVDEVNCVVDVNYIESYIDSGSDDYFYSYYLNY